MQLGCVNPNAARITPRTCVLSELNAEYGFGLVPKGLAAER
jgi:hypothetical protein